MDRPYGPRPVVRADKREAAYESIFGRPSANHHQQGAPVAPAAHYPRQQQQPLPPLPQQQPSPVLPSSYASPSAQSYAHQPYQQPYPQQAPYPYDPRQPPYGPLPPAPYAPSTFGHRPPPSAYHAGALSPNLGMLPPNPRPRSVSGHSAQSHHSHTGGILSPGEEDGQHLPQGMTPAQAYQVQAQMYINTNGAPAVRPNGNGQAGGGGGWGNGYGGGGYGMQPSGSVSDVDEGSVKYSEETFDSTSSLSSSASGHGHHTINLSHSRRPSVDSIATSVTHVGSGAYPLGVRGIAPSQRTSTATTEYTHVLHASPPPSDAHWSPSEPSSPSTPRRSSESARTLPHLGLAPAASQRTRALYPSERTRSFSSGHPSSPHHALPPIPTMSSITPRSPIKRNSRPPQVPAALLSRVAQAFLERVALSERIKDGLAYPDAFDGREAVDKIAYIIRTTDRNLALLLGRALDAQKFFHDVAYEHRLRDSALELYQFQTRLASPFVSNEQVTSPIDAVHSEGEGAGPLLPLPRRPSVRPTSSGSSSQAGGHESHQSAASSPSDLVSAISAVSPPAPGDQATPTAPTAGTQAEDIPLPTGVFTLLTDCYSPTCSRDYLCYSISCPRRLEQQSRLNMKPEAVLKTEDYEPETDLMEPGTLWIHSVPQEVVDKVSETEKKRQEAINEVIYTERDFVRDMEYLRDFWIKPLSTSDIIDESRREDFITQVFWNISDIIAVNTRLRDALNKRQKGYAIVEKLGDILLEFVPMFAPFVAYGAHQLYGKYEFEKEKSSNPAFTKFVDEVERYPESRKLELNGYLTKPTTRLARYPLLLDVVLKYTPEDSPDKQVLPQVIAIVKEFLRQVNYETGKTENRFNLLQLDQQLVYKPGEVVDLRLRDDNRELVYRGALSRKGGGGGATAEDLMLYLFDHALLMVKPKTVSKHEQLKVYRKPIPLELLITYIDESDRKASSHAARPKSSLIKGRSNSLGRNSPIQIPMTKNLAGYSMTFMHLGRKGYSLTLWANTPISRKKWFENIHKRQEILRERSAIFDMVTLSEGFFVGANKVNCAAPFSGGNKIAYGTDDGVYISDIRVLTQEPVKVLDLPEVTQVDILEEYQLLIVLTERTVMTFPLDALDPLDHSAGMRRAKRVASHTSFFKAGSCLSRLFVCIVKASSLSSTIKVLEPIDQSIRGKNKPTFRKLLQGGNDTLKVFKEFYIPTESSSIHFLRTKLCVGCTKGFEIVDLDTLDTQGLLDPADQSLEFVQKRENVKPIAIYRVDGDFLLCYDEFAFFVNKSGWRARPDWIVYWEGIPSAFALHYPYVLAFEPTFVEIRSVETSIMVQIIPGNNLRCLFADTPAYVTNSAPHHQQHPHPGYPPPHRPLGPPQAYNPAYPPPHPQFNPYAYPPGMLPPQALPPHPQHMVQRQTQPNARDEIILVSEDRVFCVKLAAEQPRVAPLPPQAVLPSLPLPQAPPAGYHPHAHMPPPQPR